jgi:hypothetical protein
MHKEFILFAKQTRAGFETLLMMHLELHDVGSAVLVSRSKDVNDHAIEDLTVSRHDCSGASMKFEQ